jgi:hypothetical protein
MIETIPEVDVQTAEYNRLLGYPRDHVLTGRARELAEWARTWYADHGRPWTYWREAVWNGGRPLGPDLCLRIDGVPFNCLRLQKMLEDAEAHAVMLVAVSAGPELEAEAQRLWSDEKPDEYFFLETFGSAVVERLTTTAGARLCDWAEGQGMAVLPHYSPGYPDWDILEQQRLLELIGPSALPGRVEVLGSGALRPKKSLLAVFGLTRHTEHLQRLVNLVPCENCSYTPCQYRRVPYVALNGRSRYAVNTKALKRWAQERLSIERREDGAIDALFRYDGTTCTNMGRPLTFHYRVKLGPREAGYPIREQQCSPAPGDTGCTSMCEYIKNAEPLMAAIDREKPLLGRSLNDILSWKRPASLAGCYCEAASRDHKWGLVLETIHYALEQKS